MKSPFCLLLSVSFLLLICSCSSDEEANTVDRLIGSWTGGLSQPDFGILETTLNIRSLDLSGSSGSGSFSTTDLSNCNNTLFNCIALSCNFNLSFLTTSGNTYKIDQILIGSSTCGDGIFEVTSVDDNTISVVWYQEEFPQNRATGRLTK